MLMKWQDFLSRVTQAGNGSLGDMAELLRSVGAKETAVAKKTGTASSGGEASPSPVTSSSGPPTPPSPSTSAPE